MNYSFSLSALVLAGFLVIAIPVDPVDAGITGYLPSLSWFNPLSYSWPSWRSNTTTLIVPKEEFDRLDTSSNSSRTYTVAENHIANSPTRVPNQTIPVSISSLEANKVTIKPKIINETIISPTTPNLSLPTPAPTSTQIDITSYPATEAPLTTTTMFKPGSISSLFTTKKPANSSSAKLNIRDGNGRVYVVPMATDQIRTQTSLQVYDGDILI